MWTTFPIENEIVADVSLSGRQNSLAVSMKILRSRWGHSPVSYRLTMPPVHVWFTRTFIRSLMWGGEDSSCPREPERTTWQEPSVSWTSWNILRNQKWCFFFFNEKILCGSRRWTAKTLMAVRNAWRGSERYAQKISSLTNDSGGREQRRQPADTTFHSSMYQSQRLCYTKVLKFWIACFVCGRPYVFNKTALS